MYKGLMCLVVGEIQAVLDFRASLATQANPSITQANDGGINPGITQDNGGGINPGNTQPNDGGMNPAITQADGGRVEDPGTSAMGTDIMVTGTVGNSAGMDVNATLAMDTAKCGGVNCSAASSPTQGSRLQLFGTVQEVPVVSIIVLVGGWIFTLDEWGVPGL